MKISHLLEDAPSQADLDWSVAKIKEVKFEIDSMSKKDKYNADKQEKATAKRETKYWQARFAEAQWRMDFAIELHEKIIPEFNKMMSTIRKAVGNKDVETLKKVQSALKKLVVDHDLLKVKRRVLHRDAYRFKLERGYPHKIGSAIDWIVDMRDQMAKLILEASRTDVQNDRAAKASVAMKARWGMF